MGYMAVIERSDSANKGQGYFFLGKESKKGGVRLEQPKIKEDDLNRFFADLISIGIPVAILAATILTVARNISP